MPLQRKHLAERRRARAKATPSSTPTFIRYAANGLRTAASGVGKALDLVLVKGIKNTGRNYVLTALAQVGGPVGAVASWARYKNYDSMQKFSPEVRKELLDAFSTSYSKEYTKPTIEIVDKYEACFRGRVIDIDLFSDINTPSKERLSVKLADLTNPQVLAVTESIKDALKKANKLANARANLNALKVHTQQSKEGFNPAVVASVTEEYHGDATTSLNAQLEAEKENIRQLFKDPTFVQNLKDTLGAGTTDKQIEQVRDDMLKSIDAAHNKAIAPVTDPKQIPDLIAKMKKDAERASDELFLIALLYSEGSDAMRARIKAQMEAQQYISVGQESEDDAAKRELRGVSLKQLGPLQSLSEQTLSDNGNGTLSLNTPSNWHWYHQAADQHLIADMMLLALSIKAQGFEKITMTIDDTRSKEDDSYRMEDARKAYKACRLIGWPADKITIKVNGEEMSAAKLFGGPPEEIEKQANAWEAARKKNDKESLHALMGNYKTQLFNTRAEEEKKATAPAGPKHKPPGLP